MTDEVFAGVTISVQLRTIDLSGKLAYFLDLMEELVIFQHRDGFGQRSKIGYVNAVTPFILYRKFLFEKARDISQFSPISAR
jgi:hypothetical protein